MDMLNYLETDQNTVWKFCNDPKGLELVAENLRLSQLFIEQVVRPRLIMVKNRGSWCFWGKEAKADENIWMGYRFEHLESLPCGDLCRIPGMIDHPGRAGGGRAGGARGGGSQTISNIAPQRNCPRRNCSPGCAG